MFAFSFRRFLLAGPIALATLMSLALACSASSARASAANLDLETLTATKAEKMLRDGQVTSVELVKAYEARIAALNKSGPDLNVVTQLNPEVMKEAKQADRDFAKHIYLGPAMGLPILIKDIIDAPPMYTSAGDWALPNRSPKRTRAWPRSCVPTAS